MRKFLKSKWHGLPLGVMSLVLVSALVVGGVAAASVALLSGSGTVTVNEAITVTQHTPTDGTVGGTSWSAMTWTVSTYPGETKVLTVKVSNVGTASIPLYASLTGSSDLVKVIKVWDGASWIEYGTDYTIRGGGDGYVQFQITADTGSPIGDKTLTLSINR
jgi:hypothetical protein